MTWWSFGYPPERGSYLSYLPRIGTEYRDYTIVRPHTWVHMCMSVETARSGWVRVVKDGAFLAGANASMAEHVRNLSVPASIFSKVNLGRCVNPWTEGCSLKGVAVADLNVWDYALTDKELVDWTGCRKHSIPDGNVVNWSKSRWTLEYMVEENLSLGEICQAPKPLDVLIDKYGIFWKGFKFLYSPFL